MKALCAIVIAVMSWSVSAELSVSDATIRVLPPTVPNTAAYFTITNSDNVRRTLVAAESDIAPRVEIHEHIMHGDMMRMQQVQQVIIPAGESVTFAPGGLHLMLFGLKKAIKDDDIISLTLQMENGEKVEVEAIAQAPNAHHHHH